MTPAQFWALEQQNQGNRQEFMQGQQKNLMKSVGQFINAYAKKEQDKSDAKIYGSLMKVIAPAFGDDGNGILQTFNSFEKDSEKADFGRTIAGSLGVIGNMYAQTNRFGLQQQGQQIQQNAPFTNAGIRNATTRAEEGDVFDGTNLP